MSSHFVHLYICLVKFSSGAGTFYGANCLLPSSYSLSWLWYHTVGQPASPVRGELTHHRQALYCLFVFTPVADFSNQLTLQSLHMLWRGKVNWYFPHTHKKKKKRVSAMAILHTNMIAHGYNSSLWCWNSKSPPPSNAWSGSGYISCPSNSLEGS